jgi:predicted DNA-binding transcriptional regulator AlpA
MKESTTSLKDTAWLANRLGLSISTIERLRIRDRDDIPPHVTIGRSIRYDEVTVEKWLVEQLQGVSHAA